MTKTLQAQFIASAILLLKDDPLSPKSLSFTLDKATELTGTKYKKVDADKAIADLSNVK